MIKPVEKMHSMSKLVQIGCSCMGQRLIGCYRTLEDEDTRKKFCMMMSWASFHDTVSFYIQESDELMHLFFEDNGCNFEREKELEENGNIELDKEIIESDVYKRVYKQLFNGISKKLLEEGYKVTEDMKIISL